MKEKVNVENKKLLLIDDDPNLILLVKDYLELKGYQVMTADNGGEALTLLEKDIPDMIICDIMMPEMDGYTLIKQIREDTRMEQIPVMFLSAKGQSQDRVKGLKTGADIYMVKPFEPEELAAQIEASLIQAERIKKSSPKITDESQRIQVSHHVNLTTTELKVLRFLAQGMSNKDISEQLNVGQRTIESHVSNMLNKTALHNRTELARWAMENNKA